MTMSIQMHALPIMLEAIKTTPLPSNAITKLALAFIPIAIGGITALLSRKILTQEQLQSQLLDACFQTDLEEAKALIKQGATIPENDERFATALTETCKGNVKSRSEKEVKLAELLIQNGLNPNTPDQTGVSAMEIVCMHRGRKSIHLAKIFSDQVDPNTLGPYNEWPFLHIAAANLNRGVARVLLEKGENITTIDEQQTTALHIACMAGKSEQSGLNFVKMLFENGGKNLIDQKDSEGNTPLHLAFRRCDQKLIEFLLDQGANTKIINNRGELPVNIQDANGNTPLHLAYFMKNTNLIQLLRNERADMNIQNHDGDTSLQLHQVQQRLQKN